MALTLLQAHGKLFQTTQIIFVKSIYYQKLFETALKMV
jgi:hypothetical protein